MYVFVKATFRASIEIKRERLHVATETKGEEEREDERKVHGKQGIRGQMKMVK